MRLRGLRGAKKALKRGPRGTPRGAKGAQKWSEWDRRVSNATIFWPPVLPKGSKILEKAAMLAANCRTAGLEGLEDWRPWI